MAITTCTVSGKVLGPDGMAISNTKIRAFITTPFIHTDGTVIGDYLIETVVDGAGDWSLTLIETESVSQKLTIAIVYPTANGTREAQYLATIPAQPTALFSAIATGI